MKSCFNYLLFLLPAFVFNSCSNDLEILADYEENAAIYGLLDPSQPIQFIKINKVFTNPGAKAGDVAKIADSLYFDSLAPVLVELDNGGVRKTIPLYRANILLKDSGTFANSPNYLYVTNMPISDRYKYRLDLWLPKTGKYVTSTTNIVNFNPASILMPIRVFTIPKNMEIPSTPSVNMQIMFTTGVNGKIYDAFFHFNYMEINKADTNIKVLKSVRWKILRSFRALTDKGNEGVSSRIAGILFYDLLLDEIHTNPAVFRRFMPCSLEFIGGNLELDNYIEASVPSIGIVQKQTDYTNINNGIGLFASRNTFVIGDIQLINSNKNLIRNDNKYKHLDFH